MILLAKLICLYYCAKEDFRPLHIITQRDHTGTRSFRLIHDDVMKPENVLEMFGDSWLVITRDVEQL